MDILVIIPIIFVVLVGFAIFMVMKTLKKLNNSETGIEVNTKDIKSSQRFLPWDDIRDDMVVLGGFKYRAIIECSSTNYALKTQMDKEITEQAFSQFLNSIQYPISIYLQTREVNYGQILKTLENDIENTEIKYPHLAEYSRVYYNEIAALKDTIESSKQKKKYIIVPFEDAVGMNELGEKEKEEYSRKELDGRCSMLSDNLHSIGIIGKRLNTKEIVELYYSVNHRDEDSACEHLSGGEYTEDIVSGDRKLRATESLRKAILILQSAENEINLGVIGKQNPDKANEIFSSISQEIAQYKKSLAEIEESGGLMGLASDEEMFSKFDENGSLIKPEEPSTTSKPSFLRRED